MIFFGTKNAITSGRALTFIALVVLFITVFRAPQIIESYLTWKSLTVESLFPMLSLLMLLVGDVLRKASCYEEARNMFLVRKITPNQN